MDSRRDFLKKAALLSGGAGMIGALPPSIQKAFAINPATGSTYLDAEHVVILMQENRSFDHCYGSLQGIRGFNDPRAIQLPNGNKVWLQSNAKGETYAPFRLNIKETKATWMGSLPHGWTDQTDARNDGRYDQWLENKQSGEKEYKDMPLTLGYYTREDIPFYYSMADAFTICDQNFCSSLTGTTPNRLHLWTGKIREDANAQARVRNEEAEYRTMASWKTFPERLQEQSISWKIYQNEVGVGVGLQGEEDAWLSNFGDNPIEYFTQFNVNLMPAHIKSLPGRAAWIKSEIARGEEKLKTLQEGSADYENVKRMLAYGHREVELVQKDIENYTLEKYAALSPQEKELHKRAFTTNSQDPDYHKLQTLKYKDGDTEREMVIPKGDIFYQFRKDVNEGKLPTVSWLVAPEKFSDHPSAPWYGAWYVSESIDILTRNPEVWKKTIFILCYDENDGYFDHVPPFVPPVSGNAATGKVSPGIDTQIEYVSLERDLERASEKYARGGPIGLGYRVPLVIASPWSRGGSVCSQVFDHTSILQFLEKFLSHKTGKKIEEPNISTWRRTVCGDLTSAFKPYNGEKIVLPKFVAKEEFVESIHKAQFKKDPSDFHALTKAEIDSANSRAAMSVLPHQEKGTRSSNALPYELQVSGKLTADKKSFEIKLEAANTLFGAHASGAPFQIYGPGKAFAMRNYAIAAGGAVVDSWSSSEFDNGQYHFKVYGPNGFFREFKGSDQDSLLEITASPELKGKTPTGKLKVTIVNKGKAVVVVEIKDNAYNQKAQMLKVAAESSAQIVIDLLSSNRWYDLSVFIQNDKGFESRFAGRVENGKDGITDPAMGG